MKSHGIWRRTRKKWGIALGIVLLASIWLAMVAASWGEAAELSDGELQRAPASERRPSATSDSDSDSEYNFKWLDPDKKIYVLQNRKYLKADRAMLSVMFGPGISNPYRDTYGVTFRGTYYFSEWLGVEAFYTYGLNSENQTFNALSSSNPNGTVPVVRQIKSQAALMLQYVPWYAKINVFNKILYFDWYFSGGGGMLGAQLDTRSTLSAPASYSDESYGAFFLGTGHLFHVSQALVVRLDLTGAYYRATVLRSGGDTTWFSNYTFGFGLGLKL